LLPFLKLKKQPVAGLIMKRRTPDESNPSETQPDSELATSGADTCAYALMSAIQSGDTAAIVNAFRDLHDIMHAEMDEQSPDKNKSEDSSLNTYKYQNVKASAHGEEF
jgi:hypothetical protein